jgi:hypothetical protein
VASRAQLLEQHIDSRLQNNSLHKTCKFRDESVEWGGRDSKPMSLDDIEAHKKSGLYHAMLSSSCALVPVVPNARLHVELEYPRWQATVSEHIRSNTLFCDLRALGSALDSSSGQLLLGAGTHVHSWPGAPPQRHELSLAPGTLTYSEGCFKLIIFGKHAPDTPVLSLLLTADQAAYESIRLILTISSMGSDGRTGQLTARLVAGADAVFATGYVSLKATPVTDSRGQLLCDWEVFKLRTDNGLARYKLCSLSVLQHLQPYRQVELESLNPHPELEP